MDDALLDQREIRYPIAIQTAISRERRLRLPEFLKIPAPFVLVENSLPEQLWLGICSIDFWAKITAEYDDGLRILAEYRTYRPTIPNAVCSKHCLQVDMPVWLVITRNWIEIFSDSVWHGAQC